MQIKDDDFLFWRTFEPKSDITKGSDDGEAIMEDQKKRKMKYEKPLLIDFMKNTAMGAAPCSAGTHAIELCSTGGFIAYTECSSGEIAFSICVSGFGVE